MVDRGGQIESVGRWVGDFEGWWGEWVGGGESSRVSGLLANAFVLSQLPRSPGR